MSTNDVPGAKAANNDVLAMGGWAEHDDGSLIFVCSTEGDKVIFDLFDMAIDPPLSYRTGMPTDAFKKEFSWDPTKKKQEKWTWHDKTPFPWDRIIKNGIKEGVGFSSAEAQLSAAARVKASLEARGISNSPRQITEESLRHLQSQISKPAPRAIADKIQAAIASCKPGQVDEALAELRALEGPK